VAVAFLVAVFAVVVHVAGFWAVVAENAYIPVRSFYHINCIF